ncbi:M56 family metallopeptidase [Arsenicibacter rosenii]|nr:M56 family metallopeptidase [Arsenicibacter rosenii]
MQQFSHPAVWALGWMLVHALWQGFALVLPVAIGFHLLRKRSARLRYNLGVGTLLVQVIVSAGTFLYYYWPLREMPAATGMPTGSFPYTFSPTMQIQATHMPWYTLLQQFVEAHMPEIVVCWLIGVAVFMVRLAGGWLYLQHLKRTAYQITDQAVLELAVALQEYLGLTRVIHIAESAAIRVPMVIGMIKPVVLLPVGLVNGLSLRQVEAVLAHEFAHIKRADFAINILQSVIEVLFFFHPALWWLSARVREERELCCDDIAIDVCGDARILARALADVEEFAQSPALAMSLASNRKQLLHRVRRMLGVPVKPFISNRSLAGLTLATILLFSVSVYAVQENITDETKPKVTSRPKKTGKTEIVFSDGKQLESVIWNGETFSPERVKKMQKLLSDLETGAIQLTSVQNPEEQELLGNLIESSRGMADRTLTLTSGLEGFASSGVNILAGKLPDFTAVQITDSVLTMNGWAKVTDYTISRDSVPVEVTSKERALIDRKIQYEKQLQRQTLSEGMIDSLRQATESLHRQMEALQRQQERENFKLEEFQRKEELLQWKKQKLMEQRAAVIEKNRRSLYATKQQLSEADLEKLMRDGEAKIKESEAQIEALSKDMEKLQQTQEEARQPYQKLERQMEQLERQQEELMRQQERHFEALSRADAHLSGFGYVVTPGNTARVPRTPRAARAPRVPRAPRVVSGVPTLATPPEPPHALSPAAPPEPVTVEGHLLPPDPLDPITIEGRPAPPRIQKAPRTRTKWKRVPAPANVPKPEED